MIEVKNVVKTFDGFRALDDLTMTVPFGGYLPAGQRRRAGGRSAGI